MENVCSFPTCGRSPRNKSGLLFCEGHYYQHRRGTPLRPLQAYGNKKCGAVSCLKTPSGKYCAMHDARVRRHGDLEAKFKPVGKIGPDNPTWVGDEAGYSTVHERLKRTKGSASSNKCTDCGDQAKQWSYDHCCENEKTSSYGPFSTDLERYQPRCTPCHKTFDLSRF